MVRLWIAGGRLSDNPAQLRQAAQHHAQGDVAAAVALYRDVLRQSPREPEALHMLGVIAQQAGNSVLALQLIETAIAARQDYAEAWVNHSLILRALGRDDDALQSAKIAAQCDSGLADAWDAQGQILTDRGDYPPAALCHERAISLSPTNAHFRGNYAALLFAMGKIREACLEACRAEALDPQWPPMILGSILKAAGYPELAALRFERALALRPGDSDAAASAAMARLQIGDMEQGWALWERRPDFETTLAAVPLWRGEKIARLVVYEDQGMGDALHFARYLIWAQARAETITLRVRSPLLRLFTDNFPALTVIADSAPLPDADARCRLSSLPALHHTLLDNIPPAPYLHAGASPSLPPGPSPRIGLVWAGNPHFRNDGARSFNFEFLRPLIDLGAQHFINLQKDRPDAPMSGPPLVDAAPLVSDFADTAALIATLDLIITVDTATAHLAGALGKAVFVMLPFDSDWRWLIGRADSPWYPTARLFRQKKPKDWPGVIEEVVPLVARLIAGDKSVLQSPAREDTVLRQNPFALPDL